MMSKAIEDTANTEELKVELKDTVQQLLDIESFIQDKIKNESTARDDKILANKIIANMPTEESLKEIIDAAEKTVNIKNSALYELYNKLTKLLAVEKPFETTASQEITSSVPPGTELELDEQEILHEEKTQSTQPGYTFFDVMEYVQTLEKDKRAEMTFETELADVFRKLVVALEGLKEEMLELAPAKIAQFGEDLHKVTEQILELQKYLVSVARGEYPQPQKDLALDLLLSFLNNAKDKVSENLKSILEKFPSTVEECRSQYKVFSDIVVAKKEMQKAKRRSSLAEELGKPVPVKKTDAPTHFPQELATVNKNITAFIDSAKTFLKSFEPQSEYSADTFQSDEDNSLLAKAAIVKVANSMKEDKESIDGKLMIFIINELPHKEQHSNELTKISKMKVTDPSELISEFKSLLSAIPLQKLATVFRDEKDYSKLHPSFKELMFTHIEKQYVELLESAVTQELSKTRKNLIDHDISPVIKSLDKDDPKTTITALKKFAALHAKANPTSIFAFFSRKKPTETEKALKRPSISAGHK